MVEMINDWKKCRDDGQLSWSEIQMCPFASKPLGFPQPSPEKITQRSAPG
jgi:hypothetical protein